MTTIRPLKDSELPLLDDFLYLAIFIPEGVQAPPREIINQPELRVYVDGFGSQTRRTCGSTWIRASSSPPCSPPLP